MLCVSFFFFKQKTAYEMRISDWSSDVCSSDLGGPLTIWPWSVNSEGNGRYFKDKASAIQWVREEQARGVRSIDVGCMQINLRWHPDAFSDLDEAFDPAANTAYSAKYLATLRSRRSEEHTSELQSLMRISYA